MPASQPLTIALTVLGTIAIGVPVASFAQSNAAMAPAVPPATDNGGAVVNAKLKITGIDAGGSVTAQVNPDQITVDKSVPWQKAATSTGDQPELTFSSADGRTMSFELLFDGTATNTNVEDAYVAKLTKLASIIDPGPGPEAKKRPPRVKVGWGQGLEMEGVIESLDVKYTKFASNGTPLKATASVKIKEASRATFKRP